VSTAVKRYQDAVKDEVQQVKKAKTPRAIADAAEAVNREYYELDLSLRRADSNLRTAQTSAEQVRRRYPEHEQFKQMLNQMRDYVKRVYAGQQQYSEQFPDLVATVVMPPAKRRALALPDAPRPSASSSSVTIEEVPASSSAVAIPAAPGGEATETEAEAGEGKGPGRANQPFVTFDRLISEVPKAPEVSRILDAAGFKASRQNTATPANVQRLVATNLLQLWMKKEKYPDKKLEEPIFFKTIRQKHASVGAPEDMMQDAVAAVQAKRDELRRLYDETRFVEKDRAVLNMAGKMRRAKQQITGVSPATRSKATGSRSSK
jgi:hypothetical protein